MFSIQLPTKQEEKTREKKQKIITIKVNSLFTLHLIAFLSQPNEHSKNKSTVHSFLTCTKYKC